MRLQNAEARLTELQSTMMALGREATAAMLSVEGQQQQITSQKLITMVFYLVSLCMKKGLLFTFHLFCISCSIYIYFV
jgi:hypothetical protein